MKMNTLWIAIGALTLSPVWSARAEDPVPAPRPTAERFLAGEPVDEEPTGVSVGRARAPEPRQGIRCYQHGVRIVDDEIAGPVAETGLRGSALVVRLAGGQQLAVFAAGNSMCMLRFGRTGTTTPSGIAR